MRTVAVLALDGVIPFDLSTPIEVFSRVRLADGSTPYEVRVCAATPSVDAGAFTLRAPWGLDVLLDADTIMVPGCADPRVAVPLEVVDHLRKAAAGGARIASVCAGAFILAATGLLDGLRATTHWLAAAELAARFPAIDVDPDVLYVDNGQFLTSAGAAAGLDLCLHLIRRDHGSAVAADAARLSVMPLEREGGQAQFIIPSPPPTPRGAGLEPLLQWMQDNTSVDLTLSDLAARSGMSIRTLNRRFREQTGTTPLQWLLRARIRRAQHLLEATDQPIESIAGQVGFGSPTAFRDRFKRIAGTSPTPTEPRSAPAIPVVTYAPNEPHREDTNRVVTYAPERTTPTVRNGPQVTTLRRDGAATAAGVAVAALLGGRVSRRSRRPTPGGR